MTDAIYSELPTEILIKIFQYLDFYDIQSVRLCCKHWLAVANRPEFDSKGIYKINSCLLDNNHPAAEMIFKRQIEKLYLKGVQFGDVDKLFQHVGTSLKRLSMKLVPITVALPLTFKYFSNLQSLTVCQIREYGNLEALPVGSLTGLKEIKIISNDSIVTKYLLKCILHAHTLKGLIVEFKPDNEADLLEVLEKLSDSLTRLDIRFYQNAMMYSYLHRWMRVLEKLNLSELSLQGSFCSDVVLSATKNQESLRSLDVTGCIVVGDEYLTMIGEKLSALETLKVGYCGRITDHGVRHLGKLTKLKTLDMSYCNLLTSAGVRSVLDHPPKSNLIELHLQQLNINEETICFCAHSLPKLRILNLSGCSSKALTNETIQNIFDCQRKLQELRMDHCCHLSDDMILGLATGSSIGNLRFLQRLSLRGCKQLSDATLVSGLRLPQLKFLDIAYCKGVTNKGLQSLVHNCPAIEEISITRSLKINYEAVEMLTEGLGRLRVITINKCENPLQFVLNNWYQFKFSNINNEVTLKRYSRRGH